MYARTEIDALETQIKKSSLTCGCIYIDMHLCKWQIKSRREQNCQAKHLSPPKCTVKSHQKLYRMTEWKHGNVEQNRNISWNKHSSLLITEIAFWKLSLDIFGNSFPRKTFTSPMNSEKKHHWSGTCLDILEGMMVSEKLTPKSFVTPNHIPKSASWPHYTRDEQHRESVRGRRRGASSSGELVKQVSFWEVFSANEKHINTLKYSGCFYRQNTLTLVVSNDNKYKT